MGLGLGTLMTGPTLASETPFSNTLSVNIDVTDGYAAFPATNLLSPNSSGADRGFSISAWLKATDKYVLATFPLQSLSYIF